MSNLFTIAVDVVSAMTCGLMTASRVAFYRSRIRNNLGQIMAAAVSLTFLTTVGQAVTVQMVPVGNAGNAADPTTGYGSVAYAYNIGKYEVTWSQYAGFLNAVDPAGTNALALYRPETVPDISFANGNDSGSKYSVVSGHGNIPANSVTWYDSIRFANWLNNGQGSGDTENGAYTLLHEGSPTPTPTPSNGLSITRNPGATVFLPSENEWYKAAYYKPDTSSYFQYPTASNTAPTATGPTGVSNSANYNHAVDHLTDVGAYTSSASAYGTFDQGGNVWEWDELLIDGSLRNLRGGSVTNPAEYLAASSSLQGVDPAFVGFAFGFRVASVPEPSTGALAMLAVCMIWLWRKRFK